MINRMVMATTAVVMATSCMATSAQSKSETDSKKRKHRALAQELKRRDGGTSMKLLNLWGEQPHSTQELYKHSFDFFKSNRLATFSDLSKSDNFKSLCAADNRVLLGGPMLGAVRPDGVSVWVRTPQLGEVTVVVAVDGTDKMYGPVQSSAATDHTAIIQIDGLKPNTSYDYRILLDNQEVIIPKGAQITTAPLNNSKDMTRIIFGSCFHRWGIGNHE